MEQSPCQTSLPDPDLSNSINNTADEDESNSVDSELPSAEEDIVDDLDCSDSELPSAEDIVDDLDCSVTSTGYVSGDGSNKENLEITSAILKALNLVDQMQGSVSDFEDILQFSKELFCRNDSKLKKLWPKDWREMQVLLKKCGYKDPTELYICLDESHYCHWDVMESPEALCKYCGNKGTIKYYYLSIKDKLQQWCGNEDMCKKNDGTLGTKGALD